MHNNDQTANVQYFAAWPISYTTFSRVLAYKVGMAVLEKYLCDGHFRFVANILQQLCYQCCHLSGCRWESGCSGDATAGLRCCSPSQLRFILYIQISLRQPACHLLPLQRQRTPKLETSSRRVSVHDPPSSATMSFVRCSYIEATDKRRYCAIVMTSLHNIVGTTIIYLTLTNDNLFDPMLRSLLNKFPICYNDDYYINYPTYLVDIMDNITNN